MIRVGVLGAGGRMGAMAARTVAGDDATELVAAVDPAHSGGDIAGVTIGDDIAALEAAGAQVAIDFTRLDVARTNLAWLAERGMHAVVGTSGFAEADLAGLRSSFTSSNCLIAPNFGVGAVLMMRFAELAAPWFETAEIIELHHDNKVDAPSGTALTTMERMEAAGGDWAADPTETETLPGSRGGALDGGAGRVRVHSVRMRGMLSHQEVVLGTDGEVLTIRHDATNIESFMPGVMLAVKGVADLPGVTVGLEPLLNL